jgi:dihydropteroate synthase
MGVLNVSKESPYKPSVFDDHGEAAAYVDERLIDEGADIVDVGLESANKKFEVLSAEGELDRLDTAIEMMNSVSGDAIFSIETRYHEVAEAALDAGFDMVNDICGFADPKMPQVCEDRNVAVAKMASPPDLERPGAVERPDDIYDALELNGLTDKTIIDPAFGGWSEAKTVKDDRETFRRLREFRGYGHPMLVSINRKNFLRSLAGRDTEGALPVSLAATSLAVERGAHVVRTHDVAETRDAAIIGDAFKRDPQHDQSVGVEKLELMSTGEVIRHLDRVGADDEHAEQAMIHTFEITGFQSEEVKRLAEILGPAAGFAPSAAGTGGILYGTPKSLRAAANTAADEARSTHLAEVMTAVRAML